MPKDTFLKLNEAKRKRLTDAFLREFALHVFDDASVSSVTKALGIAKGSVYQYFDDKLDLFLHLVAECSAVKARYIGHLKREDYPDFWAYFRSLFEEGVKFDLENPLQSHFLHNLPGNLNSPSCRQLYTGFRDQTVAAFEKMVKYEVKRGHFRNDLPARTMGFFLYKASLAISDQMQAFAGLDPRQSIERNAPVYRGKVKALMSTVDQYIVLLKGALNK